MTFYEACRIIAAFTAPQILEYFRRELSKYCLLSRQELLRRQSQFYRKLERDRELAYNGRVTKFIHRVESRYLVLSYAFAGALELSDPFSDATVEVITAQFCLAYNGLKQERNQSRAEVETCSLDDEILMRYVDQEVAYDLYNEDGFSLECDQVLSELSPIEADIVYALYEYDGTATHKQIAASLGMDPAVFCRRLKRIREKFACLL